MKTKLIRGFTYATLIVTTSLIGSIMAVSMRAEAQPTYTMTLIRPDDGPDLWLYEDSVARCYIAKSNMECLKK